MGGVQARAGRPCDAPLKRPVITMNFIFAFMSAFNFLMWMVPGSSTRIDALFLLNAIMWGAVWLISILSAIRERPEKGL